ncbi:hypothetical protein [Streptomyces sp. NPDC101249]|uniref:hypothetical protein n=1 Tax=Streptomyces sp. NPDC101249 TaxID=3366140 RepID=UPI003813782A
MILAYDEKNCGGGLDFWGMFTDPVGSMIRMVAKIVMSGALGLFDAAFTGVASDDVDASNIVSRETQWIVVYMSIGSLLFAAIKMAIDRRGESGTLAMKGLVRVALVSVVATTVIDTFAVLMERYSSYLLRKSLNEILKGIDCSGSVPDFVLLIVGCLLIIAAIIQMILLWIRLGVMVLLMGTLPMAAAASMTEWGGTWWRKHLGWMLAWLLYKPAVGLVMYTGATMISKANNQTNTQIAGMAMLLLSGIALPALLRLVVPATAALGGDAVGAATMGVAGGIASGAKSVGQAAAGAGSDGMPGGAGPSGSDGGGSSGGSGSSGEGGRGGAAGQNGGQGGSSPGGDGGSPGEGFGGGGGGAATGGGMAAAGAAAGVLAAATIAKDVAKGAADIAKSGVEGANPES